MEPDPDLATRASLFSRLREPRDESAWREFEARYGDMILAWCRRMGLHPWDAEDVRQRVLIDMCRVLGSGFQYRPELGRFRNYLGRTVRNAIAERARRAANSLPGGGEVIDVPHEGSDLDERWEEEWRDHHLRVALRGLRAAVEERHGEVLDRLMRSENSVVIAAALGLTENGVRKIKQRLLTDLRERVRRQVLDKDGFER